MTTIRREVHLMDKGHPKSSARMLQCHERYCPCQTDPQFPLLLGTLPTVLLCFCQERDYVYVKRKIALVHHCIQRYSWVLSEAL